MKNGDGDGDHVKDEYGYYAGDASVGAGFLAILLKIERATGFPRSIITQARIAKLISSGTCTSNDIQAQASVALPTCTLGAPDPSLFQIPASCFPEVSLLDNVCF